MAITNLTVDSVHFTSELPPTGTFINTAFGIVTAASDAAVELRDSKINNIIGKYFIRYLN